jgi:hypothetical protein
MASWGIITVFSAATSFAGDCGDVDNSDTVKIQDIIYLMDHL